MVDSVLANLTFLWNIAKTAFGIGFVVFVHELGHFVLAKWNGVKVDRFSIGFGRTLLSYRRGVGFRVGTGSRPPGPDDPPTYGETEYVLAILPLGGYVKMLGQNLEDQADETDQTDDPRSFNRKSVFARMQIITAGVIMNLIFGVICFAFVYTQGWTEVVAQIGSVVPGASAYKAGVRPGDDIVAIDGQRDVGYTTLRKKVSYSGAGQKILFTIKRAGVDGEQTLAIEPVRDPDDPAPTIGVLSVPSLKLDPLIPYEPLPGQAADSHKPAAASDEDDKVRVIAAGPEGGPLEPLKDYFDFLRMSDRFKDRPLVVEIERTKITKESEAKEKETVEKSTSKVTIPPHHFLDFGFQLTPGPIAAIRNDSPAQRAGLKEGDRIIAVNGLKDYDPMRLPDDVRASAGSPMKLTVSRSVEGKSAETLEITVIPDDSPPWAEAIADNPRQSPLDVPGLGLALAIEPKIQGVADGSPASKAGLKPGQVLQSIVFTAKKRPEAKSEPKANTIELNRKTSGWPLAFSLLQQSPMKSIQLTVEGSKSPITIIPEIDPKRFHPRRGLRFEVLTKDFPQQKLTDAIRRGFDEMVDNVLNVVFIFRNLKQGRVGHTAFGGILPIFQTAYASASGGWVTLMQFLGFLSVNLAVINFLPIPPLDGGQFLFLAAEKIRGKPLPEPMRDALMMCGVIFVVGLVILVNGRDLFQFIASFF